MIEVAIAWTGGKDSALALYEAQRMGYQAKCLITFVWNHEPLLAHPLDFISLQAQALRIPHQVLHVSAPFEQSYEETLSLLKRELGITGLVTGDIEVAVGHAPNWLGERAANCKIELVRPLWRRNRLELLNDLLDLGIRAAFSCVDKRWFTEDWLGTELTNDTINRLVETHDRTGLDICGEQGEYHTITTDGPLFEKRIRIYSYTKHDRDSVAYLTLEDVRLEKK